jgi:hypothetical protein
MSEKRVFVSRVLRRAVSLAIALWAVLGSVVPAYADGPIIPGYTIRDGQRVPAPAAYIRAGVIDGGLLPCGAFAAPSDLFLDPATGNLLVVDTGNNRIVFLDHQGAYRYEIGGEEAGLNGPQGVFVDADGNVWVADTGNGRVVKFAPDGTFLAEYHKPESDLLEEYGFKPTKIVLDKRGFIYTVVGSEGNLGIVVMDAGGGGCGVFGRTRVGGNLGGGRGGVGGLGGRRCGEGWGGGGVIGDI